ncbi:MAG: thiamine pyrophosphate-dependent dehydrogenase E1 component subunit alpha [Bdellovibrionales bacterium]
MAKVVSSTKQKKVKANHLAANKKNSPSSDSKKQPSLHLPQELLRAIHHNMVKSRVLEERLIKIYKVGDAFFWIGSPGEEGFGVPLGLLANKGKGHDHDWLHLHYRGTPTLIAMGMEPIDSIRLIMNRVTDPSTGGRNFSNHYCYPQWNVAPVSSPIEVQYTMAIGTAWAQKRRKAKGITIVTGGDAGTAEGDFASCLVWASRPKNELPMLITVQNNRWGISTDYESQHGEKYIADRGRAFGIRTNVINGNDPIEAYLQLESEMEYIRKTGKPSLVEARVSRLYGHSSASGANYASHEEDPVKLFEEKLLRHGVIKDKETQSLWQQFEEEFRIAAEQVKKEVGPKAESIWDHVFVNNENGDWRKF